MIKVFFTEDGYYVAGEGIEISRSCSPALTSRGDRIFLPLHHEYKVLYLALEELRQADIKEDVMVYGTSRIIDEINGNTSPLDETNTRWLEVLKRNIIPHIKTVVFFRKKSLSEIQSRIQGAHVKMLPSIDRRTLDQIIAREEQQLHTAQEAVKKSRLQRLRDFWFGGKNNGK